MPTKEYTVATVDELPDGGMKEVSIDDNKILVARVGNEYFATGATCPHYGAPLAKGAMCGKRVVCPWHHSVYNLGDGKLEEPPAVDGIPTFETRIDGNDVKVTLPDEVPKSEKPPMTSFDPKRDERTFVIVGGNNRAPQLAAIEELMRNDRMPQLDEVKSGDFDPVADLCGESAGTTSR